MSLYVCKCAYSTKIKCNYNKHIKICKQYEQPTNDIFSQRLAELQAKYEEQIAEMERKCEEKLAKMKEKCRQEIQRIKSTHLRPRDEYLPDYVHVELIKECKKRKLQYTDDMTVDELRNLIHESRAH